MMNESGKNHIVIENKRTCSGCTACYAICPQNAIHMSADAEGFRYPSVDSGVCIECGLCKKTCPLRNRTARDCKKEYYAVKNRNEETRRKSSSGGSFSLLAAYVLKKNGAIYGAAYDEEFHVNHRRETSENWEAFRGSKYVQSQMGDTFLKVREDLLQDRWVLFSGTPCQVDGLQTYLSKTKTQKDTLITCDLICHGVPSPLVWEDYLRSVSANRNEVLSVNFRDKSDCGWHNSRLRVTARNGDYLVDEPQARGFFGGAFFNHYSLRPVCYDCQYANFDRVGDFTLGDFWGVEDKYPDFDDDKGISLLMVNTQKAQSIWETIKLETDHISVSQEECVQPNLVAPSSCPANREQFWGAYKAHGMLYAGKYVGLLPVNCLERYWFKVGRKIRRLLARGGMSHFSW